MSFCFSETVAALLLQCHFDMVMVPILTVSFGFISEVIEVIQDKLFNRSSGVSFIHTGSTPNTF